LVLKIYSGDHQRPNKKGHILSCGHIWPFLRFFVIAFWPIFLLDNRNRNRKKRRGPLETKRFVVGVFQRKDVVFCGFEKTDFDFDPEKMKFQQVDRTKSEF